MKKSLIVFSVLSSLSFASAVQPAFADEPPASKCVTKSTLATHATWVARMEKDIAGYKDNPLAAAAIEKYKEELDTAWDAMEMPYCGFGSYGSASAVKSYAKHVNRARTNFLDAAKKLGAPKAVAPTKAPAEEPKGEEEAPEAPMPLASKMSVVAATRIPAGLVRGMRADAVSLLQKKLAAHFDIAEDDLVTGFFGPKTQVLVVKFQMEKGIITQEDDDGAGLVGPKTSAALNALSSN